MSKTQVFVQQADGTTRKVEVVSGGVVLLNPDEHLFIAASSDQAQVEAGAPGEVTIKLEGIGEFTVESAGEAPEAIAMAPEVSVFKAPPTIVFETARSELSDAALTHEALGVHKARVDNTEFLNREVGEDFGMGQILDMAAFSALDGEGLGGRKVAEESELDDNMMDGLAGDNEAEQVNRAPESDLVTLPSTAEDSSVTITTEQLLSQAFDVDGDRLFVTNLVLNNPEAGTLVDNGDGTWTFIPAENWNGTLTFSYQISDGEYVIPGKASLTVDPVNDAPVIALNAVLLVDDDATVSLTGSLLATDVDNSASELKYFITKTPLYGVLLVDGVEITDFSKVAFTQADLDSGRVTFRFDPRAQDKILVMEDDSFVFKVTDGENITGPATFNIHNTTVQVWGTNGDDDLTSVANFDRAGVKYHVYGFDGNDAMRGGAGADTLDGGGHASTDVTYSVWRATVTVPGATPGGDTVDYSASNASVDVDLTRAKQIGGHAEGDVLIGIENVTGSRYADTLSGDKGNNVLAGLAGADLIDGREGSDTADYRRSDAAVDVDLTRATQIGGHAEGDTLVAIENVIGSAFADSITGDAGHNFLDGDAGADTLLGGAGNDTLRGGAGADSLDGGAGTRDLADYSTSDGAVNVDLTRTGAQSGGHAEGDILVNIEDALGSRFNDVLTGDGKSNRLWGGDGDDTIYGGGFYDTIQGGAGNDWIDGGSHEDSLFGGDGNDTIYGGNGIDSIWGGDGDDYLVGYNPDGSADRNQDLLIGGAGNDTLDASHECGTQWSTLIGGSGADMLIGNGKTSSASYELTGHGDFEVNYGPGVYLDLRRQGKDADGNWIAQIDPFGRKTDAVGDTLIGIVNAVGTYSDDTLIGNHQNNEMYGVDGNDLMIGGEGNDSLWGVDGNDTLEGGLGADFLWGGMDYDIASYENAASGVNVSLELQLGARQVGTGEENGDELWYMDGLYGSNFNDTLTGRNTDDPGYMSIHNLIEGRGGNDLISGLAGNDTLDGGTGNDTLIGGVGNDLLIGGAGDDLIHAGAGDTVKGGSGFDVLKSEDSSLNIASSTTITGIERIDLTGDAKSLTVNGDAIMKNGVLDPSGGGMKALIVNGDAGDTVHFSGDSWGWKIFAENQTMNGKTYTVYEGLKDGQKVRLYVENHLGTDTDLNDAPVIALNAVLLVDDDETKSLTDSLLTTDTDNSPSELKYFITKTPLYGVLLFDGVEITDFSKAVFTQADLDSGRVTFRFDPHPQDQILVMEDDSFVFKVTDGVNTTSQATFRIHNTTVQVWGTNGDDDLTSVANFDRAGVKYHVYGFDGNDAMRGGAGADTLDGGGHASTDVTYSVWRATVTVPGATPDGDTVDYSASNASVDVDLTRAKQIGGHAEGDVLIGIENVTGSRYADTLSGDKSNNVLAGLAGADLIDGREGRDTADYRRSDVAVDVDLTRTGAQSGGHAEGDTLVAIENVIGSAFADSIVGDAGHNFLDGGAGNDTLLGGIGNDTLRGGAGADYLDGGTGPTNWRGEMSQDLADYSTSDAAVNVDLTRTGVQSGGHAEGDILVNIEGVVGTRFSDVITGDGKSNRLWGGDGDDTIFGGGFYDTIQGGAGNDWIDGGTHEDDLYGGAGNDTIYGGNGIDSLWGGDGDDYLVGYNPDGSADRNQDLLVGGAGNDTLDASHECGSDWSTLIGGMGGDMLIGNGKTSSASYELTGHGDFEVNYGPGVYLDLRRQGKDADGNWIAQIDPFGRKTDAVGDTLIGIVNAVGTYSDDTLIGNHQNNEMYGVGGHDLMIGGEGNDSLWGVDGNDTLEGGLGADFLWGGLDYDIASYENAASGVNVSLEIQNGGLQSGTGEENGDRLWYMDGLYGSEFNDTLTGRNSDDPAGPLYLSTHNLIEGRGGNDLISGLAGNDTLDGGTGNDTLIGGVGNDLLIGGAGDDLIHAGAGDTVDGGSGFDVLRSEDAHLNVTSSTTITGIERIDLTGAGKNLTVNGDAILNNGVADPAGSGRMAMVVTGDQGDVVTRDSGNGWTWTKVGQDVALGDDGNTYVLFEAVKDGKTIRLYVQTGLSEGEITDGVVKITGTEGHDDLTVGWDFDDPQYTFHVQGLEGNDTLRGGSGADTLDGGGHAYAQHSPWVYTQEGGDTVDYGASTAAVDIDLTRATQTGGHAEGDSLVGVENVIGSGFNDSIAGDATANLLSGLAGDDTLLGREGNDTLRGGAGADLIDGGVGQDFADYRDSAGWVNVDLNIQDGSTAQSGGGAGSHALGDTLVGIESIIGSAFADSIVGNGGNNHLIGLGGDDTLIGGAGNDTLVSGAGADRVDGGTGTRDLADCSGSTAWVNVDLNIQNGTTAQSGGGAGNHAEGDILTGIEDVNGSQYGDSLTGNGVSNRIWAYDGDDTIFGGGFYDTIHGGDGNDLIDGGSHEDSLFGGEGNDTINGGTGIDSIWGGAGDDSLYGGTGDTQDLLIGGVGNDTLDGGSATRWDTLIGGIGADRIIGNGVNSSASYELTGYGDFDVSWQGVYLDLRLQGLDADGNLMVQPGKPGGDDATGDILTGIVNAVGSNGSDTLIGNDQNNEMYGVDGNDLMIGGAGNDELWGVNNNDTLEGGLGADFIWGGMDYDIASYANAASGVNVSLEIQLGGRQVGTGEENGDELWYMDGLWGSEHNDTLTGRNTDDPQYMSIHNIIEGRGGNDLISGLAGNDTLDGGTGNDTLIGGVGVDLLLGGADHDLLIGGLTDTAHGGDGFDTFRLEDNIGTGSTFDLSAMNDAGRITGIERIDITGDADDSNTLTLKANDVFQVSGGSLYVDGDVGDSVTSIGAGWTQQAADVTHNGQTYHHYTSIYDSHTVNLYVDVDVTYQTHS